jgi:hypothetical protein
VEAAADRCELLWLVDQTLGDIVGMFPRLRRYGTVIAGGPGLARTPTDSAGLTALRRDDRLDRA